MRWQLFLRRVGIWIVLRLGRASLVAVSVFGPTLAFSASSTVSNGHNWSVVLYGQHVAGDALSACAAGIAAYNSATGGSLGPVTQVAGPVGGDPNHYLCQNSYGGGLADVYQMTGPGSCAVGYTYQADGSCKSNQPSCPAAGGSAPGGNSASGTSPTQTILNSQVCVGGCAYNYSSYWTGATPGQNGSYPAQYTGLSSTGSACSGTGTPSAAQPSPTDPPKQCGDRQYSGTVNGASVCIDYPIQTTGGQTTTTTNDAPASSPAAGSTSSSQTSTTCDGTTCTTTTTTNTSTSGGAGGGASGAAGSTCQGGAGASAVAGTCTSTTTQPQEDYCKSNPTAAQCKRDSASGGADCTAPPTCDGDAISCAILSQQWNTRCDLQKKDDPSVTLGQQIQAGNDPMASQLPTPGKADSNPVSMADKFSNVDNMGVAEQCLQPVGFSVFGFSYSFDTGPLCKLGQVLGMLNVMGTLMLCAYMLKGSF